ncbi:tuftelin-like isoform X2 [Molothrus ater]|uniref:tuftelin-like isoform X2 n=1 Tax=Molothrus ater TaxID=84834 RepID=UPI001749645A|nr:tuftelin-like isoform X2 [Molothrus ater]
MEFLEFWEFQEVQESSEEDPKALRLLWRLQEAEKWHQLERSGLERALLWCQEDAERADSARSRAETEVEQLQRLLAGMEKDHRHLLVRMELGQADLERLRKAERERAAQQEWWEFKNGNSLQNSKSVIQAKDAAIQELKERVSYLEAENLEMHDQIEHLIEKQVSRGRSSARTRSKSEYVSRCSRNSGIRVRNSGIWVGNGGIQVGNSRISSGFGDSPCIRQ